MSAIAHNCSWCGSPGGIHSDKERGYQYLCKACYGAREQTELYALARRDSLVMEALEQAAQEREALLKEIETERRCALHPHLKELCATCGHERNRHYIRRGFCSECTNLRFCRKFRGGRRS